MPAYYDRANAEEYGLRFYPDVPAMKGFHATGPRATGTISWEGSYRVEVPQQASAAATATASVAGRITDANKRPVRNAGVTATGPRTYNAATNAEGDYVLNGMLPGAYLLTVSPGQSQSIVPGPAYFPAGTARDTASRVPDPGRTTDCWDRFRSRIAEGVQGLGKGFESTSRRSAQIHRGSSNHTARLSIRALLMTNTSPNASQGEFELMLPAGAWDIFPVVPTLTQPAQMPSSGTAVYSSGRAPVTISDRNVEGLSISLTSADITGRVAIDSRLTRPAGFHCRAWKFSLKRWTERQRLSGTPCVPPKSPRMARVHHSVDSAWRVPPPRFIYCGGRFFF
jgi:hypothetical protein